MRGKMEKLDRKQPESKPFVAGKSLHKVAEGSQTIRSTTYGKTGIVGGYDPYGYTVYIRVKTNTRGLYHYPISYAVGAGKIPRTRAVDDTFIGSACAWPRLAGTLGRLKRAINSIRRLLNGSPIKSRNC